LDIENFGVWPNHWSDAALKTAKDMASVYSEGKRALHTIRVGASNAFAVVTKNTVEHVDSLVGKERHAFGTIEGKPCIVIEGGGIHMVVQDTLTSNEIRCFIQEQNTDRFIATFWKRVAVYGNICYGRDGTPISVKAGDLRVMRDDGKLPSIQQIIGIYA